MARGNSFVLLFVIATAVSLVTRRFRIPYTVVLVLVGLALGPTHLVEAPPLTHDLLFTLILPGLLFEAAFNLHVEEFRRDGVTLFSLAVPGVVITIGIIAFLLGPAVGLLGVDPSEIPARHAALVFGTLMSATDPVAVVALFRSLDAPRRLRVLIEGESLLNDGTAIIFFGLAIGAANGSGGGPTATLLTDFIYIVGAGLMVGAAIGFAVDQGIRRVDDATLEVMLTTIAAYGSFIAAESLGASGVIATVTAGVLCGSSTSRSGLSVEARMAVGTFWDYLAYALNSVVFLLIGFVVQVPNLLAHWKAIVAAFVLVTLVRAIVTSGLGAALPASLRIPARWRAILAWGGLRGALSMVLALSLPPDFPQRELLVSMTFGVVIVSVLMQGFTVGPALRWLGLDRPSHTPSDFSETRAALLAAHTALEELSRTGDLVVTDDSMRRALGTEYDVRRRHAQEELHALVRHVGDAGRINGEAGGMEDRPSDTDAAVASMSRSARRLLYVTERQRIQSAFRTGAMTNEARYALLADLDATWWDVRNGESGE